jgi:hypothetical protein
LYCMLLMSCRYVRSAIPQQSNRDVLIQSD